MTYGQSGPGAPFNAPGPLQIGGPQPSSNPRIIGPQQQAVQGVHSNALGLGQGGIGSSSSSGGGGGQDQSQQGLASLSLFASPLAAPGYPSYASFDTQLQGVGFGPDPGQPGAQAAV